MNIRLSSICIVVIFEICSGRENASILMALHTSRKNLPVSSWVSFSDIPGKRRLSLLPCCSSWSSSERRSTTVFCYSKISWSLRAISTYSGCSWRLDSVDIMSMNSSWVGLVMFFKSVWMSGPLRASVKHRAKWSGNISLDIAAELGEYCYRAWSGYDHYTITKQLITGIQCLHSMVE